MSKFRSIVSVSTLKGGEIIQFPTQGTLLERSQKPWSYGYVHQIEYNARHNDNVVSINVLPVISVQEAQGSDFRYRILKQDDVGTTLGLDQNKIWAIALAPVPLLNTPEHMGRKDETVQRIGDISETLAQSDLLDMISDLGGEEKLAHRMSGAPGMRRPSENTWGLYAPIGITRENEEDEYIDKPRYTKKKKPDYEGLALDIDLDQAVKSLGLNQRIVDLLQTPIDGNAQPITTLKSAFNLVKNPDELDKYLPEIRDGGIETKLEDLKDIEIHIAVVNGLAKPREGSNVEPIIDLKSAYTLVIERPEELSQYSYLGPKFKQVAVEDITDAYEARLLVDMVPTIKSTWQELTNVYLESKKTGIIPDSFLDESRAPVWKFVPNPI